MKQKAGFPPSVTLFHIRKALAASVHRGGFFPAVFLSPVTVCLIG